MDMDTKNPGVFYPDPRQQNLYEPCHERRDGMTTTDVLWEVPAGQLRMRLQVTQVSKGISVAAGSWVFPVLYKAVLKAASWTTSRLAVADDDQGITRHEYHMGHTNVEELISEVVYPPKKLQLHRIIKHNNKTSCYGGDYDIS